MLTLTRKYSLKSTHFKIFSNFASFPGIKLTYYAKPINDLTIFDSLLLKRSLHLEYNYNNLSNKPLFFLLSGNQENDKITQQCNENLRTIKQNFEKIKNLSTKDANLDSNLKKTLNDLKQYSDNNTIDSHLQEIVGKYEPLKNYIDLFKEIKINIFSFVSQFEKLDDHEKKNKFLLNLASVSSLNIFINVLDLDIWQKIILIIFNNFDLFEQNQSFITITQNIIEIMNFFRFRMNDTTISLSNIFFFEEKEIISILNKHLFTRIFQQIEKSFQKCLENKEFHNLEKICSNYNQICLLTFKFSRIQSLDYHQIRNFSEGLKKIILNDIENLSMKNCLIFYKNFGTFGINDKDILDKFNNHFKANLEILQKEDENFTMGCLMSNWKSNGICDEVLFEKYARPKLLRMISNPNSKKYSTLSNLFYDLVCMKIFEPELITGILNVFQKTEIDNLPLFNKKSMHNALQFLLSSDKIAFDFKPYVVMINKLSKFCINLNYNKTMQNYEQINPSPVFNQLKLVDCCHNATILEIKNSAKNNENDWKSLDQKNSLSFQEKLIISSIKEHFLQNVTEKVTIYEDYQVCLYKIDVAFFFEKNEERVALEICGKPYGLENGNFLGKKQMKFQLLEKLGWKVVLLDISEKKFFNMLGYFNKQVSETFSNDIMKKMEEKLARNIEFKKADKVFSAFSFPPKTQKTLKTNKSPFMKKN